jgi:hypothetical protein
MSVRANSPSELRRFVAAGGCLLVQRGWLALDGWKRRGGSVRSSMEGKATRCNQVMDGALTSAVRNPAVRFPWDKVP